MPKLLLTPEQVERMETEHKILLECVKHYADEENWGASGISPIPYQDVWAEDEDGFYTAVSALEKIKELGDIV